MFFDINSENFVIERYIEGIPVVNINTLNLKSCSLLKKFNKENIPICHLKNKTKKYLNRHRRIFLNQNKKFVFKIWQKNYAATKQFLKAVRLHFYEKIALIAGLIFDEHECRGYITPTLIDFRKKKKEWLSYGFLLEKNHNNVKSFALYDHQPAIYKKFFDKLIKNIQRTHLVFLDLCPINVGINPQDNTLYLFDLEDVVTLSKFYESLKKKDIYPYTPPDYYHMIKTYLINFYNS